ncbi:MvdC/MvdD family ATP grasp protein [Mycolicibacterium llatzerense]|uniref:MvdC/MvdD family ATP grasp protein n=1 Tax=Mycolicibacterium llatzerense TaxID=280871 RepID=UPI0008DC9B3C|nr:hypothetical protein [Mycolicibacterium llatzerense]
MPKPFVLVITSQPDTHINAVSRLLTERAVDLVRLNTEDLFTNARLDICPRTGTGRIDIVDSGRSVDIDEVSAVWYRKPETPSIDHLTVDGDGARRFFEAEAYENLLSLYAVLQDRPWINNPLTTRLAFRRFHQLKVANRVGLRTVRSIFSNDTDAVFRFADQIDGALALKSLSALSVSTSTDGTVTQQYGVLTRPVDRGQLEQLRANVGVMPTFLQEYIDKSADLRVVCVGERVFACRIDSQADELTRHDFRIGTKSLDHQLITLPESLINRMHTFMDNLGIDFGCFDFLEVESGEPYFLECNPNGQWLWLQERTGAPISTALADHLARLATGR